MKTSILSFYACTLLLAACSRYEEDLKTTPEEAPAPQAAAGNAGNARVAGATSAYDESILADAPVAYWNNASGNDLTSGNLDAVLVNSPSTAIMPNGDQSLLFNGINERADIADAPQLSVPANGALTFEAWIRPDVLDFTDLEGSGYVLWMGKGAAQNYEYAARMYPLHPSAADATRASRLSGNVFNLEGGTSASSHYQPTTAWPFSAGEWIHFVFIINKAGDYTKVYVHRRSADGTIVTFEDQDALGYITPGAGNAPLRIGTRDMNSFFQGAIGKIAIYNYELTGTRALAHAGKMYDYDSDILADEPIAYWDDATANDLTAKAHHGVLVHAPGSSTLPNGDRCLLFNGIDQYAEIPDAADLSVPHTGVLTLEAWIRPDVLHFSDLEGSGYVYWMGKGIPGEYEYATRMYGMYPTGNDSDRPNRISGYVHNPQGLQGAGSYYQASPSWPVQAGEWIHYVLVINTEPGPADVASYPTGYTKLYVHRRNTSGTVVSFQDQDALIDYNIEPVAGTAPFRIGTRNMQSHFKGAIGKIAVYDYELTGARALQHAQKMFE